MPGRPVDPRFGQRMRELLQERGMSYRGLERRVYQSKSVLHDLANGRKTPTVDTAARIDEALAAGGELAALAEHCEPWSFGEGWHRAESERLADVLSCVVPGPGNAVALAHQWLITDPPQLYEIRAGRRIGVTTVERVELRVHQMRLIDDHVGGIETNAMVSAELAATSALLREAAYTEPLGRRLLRAVAELCQLAGLVAQDAGRHGDARRLLLAGVRAAHAAGDNASAANNLSTLGYLMAETNPRSAVILTRTAYVGSRTTATATARALFLGRVAWAHAQAGEPNPAAQALGEVEDVYERRAPDDDPMWTYWLTAEEVEVMAGRVWTQLRRPVRAVPILERATMGYDGNNVPRETALYTTWLAEALLQAGEVEQATDAATRALTAACEARSHRAMERIDIVRGQLLAVGGPDVAAFEDTYHACIK
jgi:transcriptional regulator with XRE-family HTH domain